MKECARCGNEVSDEYHRVNCNNSGVLCSCPRCTPDGETLTAIEEESQSARYEERLDQIREGKSFAETD